MKPSILIIDDCPDARLVISVCLRVEGFAVDSVENGFEALELFEKGLKPSLILLDMQLKDMSGLHFLTLFEQKYPELLEQIPVVFHSGVNTIPQSKAVGFIRKPADLKTFIKTIRDYIELGSTLSHSQVH